MSHSIKVVAIKLFCVLAIPTVCLTFFYILPLFRSEKPAFIFCAVCSRFSCFDWIIQNDRLIWPCHWKYSIGVNSTSAKLKETALRRLRKKWEVLVEVGKGTGWIQKGCFVNIFELLNPRVLLNRRRPARCHGTMCFQISARRSSCFYAQVQPFPNGLSAATT